MPAMRWECVPDHRHPGDWRVEGMEYEGPILTDGPQNVTIFCGDDAEAQAREFLAWKSGQ